MIKRTLPVVAFMIILSACASKSPNPSREITIEMSDFAYNLPSVTVPAGETIILTVKNVGQAEHDFVVEKIDVTTKVIEDNGSNAHHAHGDEQLYDLHISARTGETSMIEFTALESGTYKIFCSVEGHEEAGMISELTVLPQD